MLTGTPLSLQYGEVLNLVLSSKKAGTAVVEFATIKAAVSAGGGFGGPWWPHYFRVGASTVGLLSLGIHTPRGSPTPPPIPESRGTASKDKGEQRPTLFPASHPLPSFGSWHTLQECFASLPTPKLEGSYPPLTHEEG